MSDLIERLHKEAGGIRWPLTPERVEELAGFEYEILCAEAAAELERRTAEIERVTKLHHGLMSAADDRWQEQYNEVQRLTAELATAKADRNTYDSAHKTEAANVLRLTAENAALRVDGERLDWLQANDDDWPHMNLNCEWVTFYLAGPEGGDKGAGVCESHHSSLRAAIDSARAKESGDG